MHNTSGGSLHRRVHNSNQSSSFWERWSSLVQLQEVRRIKSVETAGASHSDEITCFLKNVRNSMNTPTCLLWILQTFHKWAGKVQVNVWSKNSDICISHTSSLWKISEVQFMAKSSFCVTFCRCFEFRFFLWYLNPLYKMYFCIKSQLMTNRLKLEKYYWAQTAHLQRKICFIHLISNCHCSNLGQLLTKSGLVLDFTDTSWK